MIKKIPLFGVANSTEIGKITLEVLNSGQLANGSYVDKFEKGIGDIINQRNVVSTHDMTSAMFLSLHLSGVQPGDDVLTTSFACLSTNSAIAHCGARPVWVDLDHKSINYNLEDLVNKITEKTKAIIVYHLAGYPLATKEIADICQTHNIKLIEDCNNALFAFYDDMHVGFYGDFSVYSFYPNRQLHTIEGGAIVCKSDDDAIRARRLRRFGIDVDLFRDVSGEIDSSADVGEIGWAYTMNNVSAAIGCAQLEYASGKSEITKQNALKLSQGIENLRKVELVKPLNDSSPSYWVLLLFVEDRDKVLHAMKAMGISVSILHQRNDRYGGFCGDGLFELPNLSSLQRAIMAIPCGWWLSDHDINYIVTCLKKAVV